MSEVKITDLVSQETIEKIKELNTEIQHLLTTYTETAKELAKGVDINVKVVGDIDKLEKLLVEKSKEAAITGEKLNSVISEQGKVLNATTNVIARELAEQEKLNKSQREAYTDTEKFKALLEKVNGSYEQRVKRLVEVDGEIRKLKEQEAALNKEFKNGLIDQQRYTEKMTELTIHSRALKQEKADLNIQMKNEEREMQSVEGSYRNLSQRLELMKKAYKDLTDEEKSSELGKEMEESIQSLDLHLKDMAADMGEFQRNVGNYAIATAGLKKNYDTLVGTLATLQTEYQKLSEEDKAGEEGQILAKKIEETSQAAREAKQAFDEQTQAVESAKKSLGETSGSAASVKKDLKGLVLEIANLTIEYQNLSAEEQNSAEGQALAEHIRDLTEKAGVLKDAISDTNQAISNAASDTRGFDQVGGALQLAIDGFGLATGAAEMLGISSGELAEIQTKLQAAIAASNAMQSIQNLLQSQSAVIQGVNLVQTKLRVVAENLHTAAKGRGVIATTALTAAQWAFNAAASANPIGLLVVAIVAATAAVWGLCKAFAAIFGPSKEALEQYKEQAKALDEMSEANDRNIERMKARGESESAILAQSINNKQQEKEAAESLFERAKELYDEDDDKYQEALERKKKADEEFESSKEDGYNFLMKLNDEMHAKEREEEIGTLAYKLEIIENEKQKQLELAGILLKNGKITRQMYEDIAASVNKAAELKIKDVKDAESKKTSTRSSGGGGRNRADDAKKQVEDLKKEVEKGEDALVNIISDGLNRQYLVEQLAYQRQMQALKDKLSKTKETNVKMTTALHRQMEGLEAEHVRKLEAIHMSRVERANQAQASFIAARIAAEKEGSDEWISLKLQELQNQKNAEINATVKMENEVSISHEQAEQMRVDITAKYSNKELELYDEIARKKAEIIMAAHADEQDSLNNSYIQDTNNLKSKYLKDYESAKGNKDKIEKLNKKFERDQARLSEEYAIKTAQASVDSFEEILKSENLSAEDRKRIEKELANAKNAVETAIADHAIAEMKRTTDADNEANEERLRNTEEWMNRALTALTEVNNLMSALSDRKVQKIEDEVEANSDAVEREKEQITDLVDKQVITQEEGEARKRAAEALTAKKNEELEKKKAQIKYRQAVFDKALAVANIGMNTALALMKLWVEPAWPAAIPLQAIVAALGALQVATVIATPIPKYAKGTDYHKGGPAIVGDGGRPELVLFNGGAWLSPDTPTLVNIPAGASVIPKVEEFASNPVSLLQATYQESTSVPKPYNDAAMRKAVAELAFLLRAFAKQRHEDSVKSNYELFKSKI